MPDRISEVPTWVNGQPAERLPVFDRGLAYGDGVFETIRVGAQSPVLLDLHMQRLHEGLARLRIDYDAGALTEEISQYPGFQQSSIVKIIITRGVGGRGYSEANVQGPTRVFSTHPLPEYPPQYAAEGISVFPCRQRLALNATLAGIKHLNRLEQVLARQEWVGDRYQEGLMLDARGCVIEGVFSNVFAVIDGQVHTPLLEHAGVAGVMRRWLLEQFAEHGISIRVGQVTLQDIQLADEWFFCNSVYGIWPVRQWENRSWTVGQITRQAQQWVMDRWQF